VNVGSFMSEQLLSSLHGHDGGLSKVFSSKLLSSKFRSLASHVCADTDEYSKVLNKLNVSLFNLLYVIFLQFLCAFEEVGHSQILRGKAEFLGRL
jgi:hypothetical protein